jgi:hypothetical protein
MALVSDDFVSWVDVLFSSGLVIAVVMDDCGLVGLLVGWSSYGFVCWSTAHFRVKEFVLFRSSQMVNWFGPFQIKELKREQ